MSDDEGDPPNDARMLAGGWAWCPRCDTRERVPMPMSVRAFVAWGAYHAEVHRYCQERRTAHVPGTEPDERVPGTGGTIDYEETAPGEFGAKRQTRPRDG